MELLEYLAATNSPLGGMLNALCEHVQLIVGNSAIFDTIAEGDAICVRYRSADGSPVSRHEVDFFVGSTVLGLRESLGNAFTPIALRFNYQRPKDTARYAALFQAPLEFDSDPGVLISQSDLRREMSGRDPQLQQILRRQAHRELSDGAPPRHTTVDDVERVIIAGLGQRELPSLSEVATSLHLSERTLKRRLSELGTHFRGCTDRVRQREALRLLRDGAMGVSDIAAQLAFSDAGAFAKAFQRWQGLTPRQYRLKH